MEAPDASGPFIATHDAEDPNGTIRCGGVIVFTAHPAVRDCA